jgi:hypothetical protein
MNVGQYYLPPYKECTVEFLRDLFAGRKMVSDNLLIDYRLYSMKR